MKEPRIYKHIVSKDGNDSMLIDPALDAYTSLAPMGEYVRNEDYIALKKKHEDLEYSRGYIPYSEYRSASDKWCELYHKTADFAEKAYLETAKLRSVAQDNKSECEATRIENAKLRTEMERMTVWQPIETLPMFQEGLIVCEGLGGIYFGTRYKSGVDSSQVDVEKYKPTHWMPLPPPPVAEGV